MLRIPCPYCGLRDQDEFRCDGESGRPMPAKPNNADDEEWAEHLFYRDNTRGLHQECWWHEFGCGQWFILRRDTLTHEIIEACRMGETPTGSGTANADNHDG